MPEERIAQSLPPELTAEAHPALAAAMSAELDAIIAAQVAQLRACLPTLAPLSDDEVVDDLSGVLRAAVHVLADPASERELRVQSPSHGITRFGQGLTPGALGREYGLLRRTAVDRLRGRLGRGLTGDEEQALHGLMDYLATRAFESYDRQKERQIRLEAESMAQFLAGLAHDVRNSLNGAMLSMQLAAHTAAGAAGASELPDELREELRTLRDDLSETHRTVDATVASMTRLLEAERLRAGAAKMRPQEVALRPLLESAMRAVARGAGLRPDGSPLDQGAGGSLQISVDCPDGAALHTDLELLSTVVLNLAGNAVRHAPGAPVVLRASDAGGGAWRIEVIDAGPGIPPGQKAALFERFVRGTEAAPGGGQPNRPAGTGLGLFIVRRAADLIGATVSVESEVGRGSTFGVVVPSRPGGQAGPLTGAGPARA